MLRTKRAFKMKQKVFFIIFEGLSLKHIKKFFWQSENPTLMLFSRKVALFLFMKGVITFWQQKCLKFVEI